MELRPPRAKKSHTQSSSAWNAVQNRKMFQLQKNREVQTQWNTSHTHLERGTNFIIIQVRLHHRTAWNAAFTTWKKAAQNLHPAAAAAPAAAPSTRPVAAPSIQMSKFLQKPTLHVKENGWNDDINNHIAQPHHITSSHITIDKNRT